MVDLGLPSRTLWCKYNVGATCGDTAESWYGGYYLWTGLSDCTDINIKVTKYKCPYNDAKTFTLDNWTKYIPLHGESKKSDGLWYLEPADDIVFQTSSIIKLHMPTATQSYELYTNTTTEWAKNYNGIKDLNGCIFKSK